MTEDPPLHARIEALRVALRDTDALSPVLDQFHRTLAEHPPFVDASVQARDEVIEHAVATAMGSLVRADEPVALVLLRVAAYDMWHGVAYCAGSVGGFFAFDDTRQICLGVATGDGRQHVFRMTWTLARTPGGLLSVQKGPRGRA